MDDLSETRQVEASTSSSADRTLLITRICCGGLIVLDALAFYYSTFVGIFLLPIAIGALVPLFNVPKWDALIEGIDTHLHARRQAASGKTGKFARLFSQPLWAGSVFVHGTAKSIPLDNVRAAVRLTLLLYYFGIFLSIAGFIAYISIAILIAIAVLLFVLWLGLRIMSGGPLWEPNGGRGGGGGGGDDERSHPGISATGKTRQKDGFLGMDPHLVHEDEHGNKVWEGRKVGGFLGMDPHVEYRDAEGNVVEGREAGGFLGLDPHTEYTSGGQVVGEGRHSDGFLGLDPHTNISDAEGNKIGATRHRDGFLGLDPHTDHSED